MIDVMTFDGSILICADGSSTIIMTREQAAQVAGLLVKAVAASNAGQSGVVGHVDPARPNKRSSYAPTLLGPVRRLAKAVRGGKAKGSPSS